MTDDFFGLQESNEDERADVVMKELTKSRPAGFWTVCVSFIVFAAMVVLLMVFGFPSITLPDFGVFSDGPLFLWVVVLAFLGFFPILFAIVVFYFSDFGRRRYF